MALLCVKARGFYGYNSASFLSDVRIVSRFSVFRHHAITSLQSFSMIKVVSGQCKTPIFTVIFSIIRSFNISVSELFLQCCLINEYLLKYSRIMINLRLLVWFAVGILLSKYASDNTVSFIFYLSKIIKKNIVSCLYKFENIW